MSVRRKSERAGEGRNGAGSQFSMNKTFIDICICRRKMSSKRNQQQNEAGARKGNKKWDPRTVGKKTGPAVNRWHHQLARACLRSHLGMHASSCSHEKNNCVPRDGAGESTWSETRASVTQKQSWLSSTRSQLPANNVINELQWKLMKALIYSLAGRRAAWY